MAPPSQYAAHNERQPFSMSSHSSQATRTSRSPPFFNGMDRAMPPVKMSPQIHVYEPYLSISPSGSSGREQYPAFSSAAEFPTRQIMVQDSSQLHQPENPIARFIHEDSSWDPLGGRQNGVPLNLGVFPEYTVYRNTTAPSEVDTIGPATIISDSAYGSMPRQSVGQPSVYGDMDHCAETQSLIQGVSDFQFHPGLSPDAIPPRGDQSEKKSWDQHGAPANPETNSLVCPHCKAQVKTKSELKKHEQRHSKPHRCNIENCPRNGDGFSTLNDLARHRQTVHKIGGHKYRCHIGQCANKKKDWPRADNFKQHLQRVHNFQTNDLEKFKATSSEATQQSHSGLPESAPPQPSVQTVPVSHWGQTLTINAAMNHLAEPIPRQLVTNPQLSVGSPSIDGSTLGDIDESQYADQIPFDGMGLDGKMGNIIPQLEPTTQNLPSDRGSSDQTIDTPHSYINPDILNHIGLRTFPGDQTGPKNIPSEILELESEGPTTFNQDEQETDFRADQRAFPVIPCKMIADYDQDVASEHEDSNDSDLTGASDRAEHSPSPRAESDADSPPKAESEPLKLDAHTAASSPESMNLDETDASDLVQRLMQKQVLDKLLQQFGYRMVKESDIKDQTKESAISEPQTNVPGGRHACDQCNKTFSRACELRKHRKRHDKPYACTYAQCKKRFGSKNDWKRHENSQHFQLECWKCNEKPKDFPNEICGKVCHRRETFTNHLEKDHGLDQKAIEGKWATCRVGRNCETQFWCGFCKTVVELVNGLAWTERFNHIDEHFNGRNGKPKADISEWETVESESSEPVEFLQSPKPQASRGRPLSTEQSKKRGRSGSTDGSSRIHSKKFRAEDGELFWSCCECSTMWNPATTGTSCLTCRHDQCSECPMEAHKITEDVATVS